MGNKFVFKKYYVYILKSEVCQKNYIGFSENPARRLQWHNEGKSRWSRRYIPWQLMYTEEFDNRAAALKREKQLKNYKNKTYIKQISAGRCLR